MGTYYAVQHNGYPMSEFENIEHPEIIRGIHLAYVEAGAKLLRTNTFAANCKTLNTQADELIKSSKPATESPEKRRRIETFLLPRTSALSREHGSCTGAGE
jgi:hypothetical protein